MKLNLLLTVIAISIGFGITQFVEFPSSNEISVTQVPIEVNYNRVDYGQEIPDIQLTSIDGKIINIHDLRGNTILINFWASWCTPCIVELPDLLALAKNNPDIFVILLSSDLTKEALDKHINILPKEEIRQSNVIIAWDERGKITRDIFQTFQLPETVLIDEKGLLQHKFVGIIDWGNSEVLKLINGL